MKVSLMSTGSCARAVTSGSVAAGRDTVAVGCLCVVTVNAISCNSNCQLSLQTVTIAVRVDSLL
jgi:hypothetical protein